MAIATNAWDLIKRQLESRLSSDSFQNWVSKTEFSHIQDNKLCVVVPNQETRDWMDSEYSGLVNSMCRDMGLGVSTVIYELTSPSRQNGNGNGKNVEPLLRDDLLDAPRTP